MGKLPKMKKRGISVHSRAARRATSPELALGERPSTAASAEGKSKEVKPYVLAAYNAGIAKNSKRRQASRAQKIRQRKVVERADVTADTLDRKLQKSVGRHRRTKARRGDWEGLAASLDNEWRTSEPAAVENQLKETNIFRNLDVEGEKKISELPYAYTGAKMTLPLFSGKPLPRAVQPPKEDFDEGQAIS